MSTDEQTTAAVAPWERQLDESARAFAAFAAYRDQPRDRRNQRAVAQALGKSATIIHRWSARHGWVERVAAWDAEQDRVARAAQLRVIQEMHERHARLAMAVQQKAAEALRDMPAGELAPRDVARWLDVAVRIERTARGEPADIVEERRRDEATEHAERLYERLAGLAAELAALDGGAADGGLPPDD